MRGGGGTVCVWCAACVCAVHACTYVTGSEKRDLNSLFKMRVLQRSVFPQCFAQSKWNTGVLRRRRCCSNDAEMKS